MEWRGGTLIAKRHVRRCLTRGVSPFARSTPIPRSWADRDQPGWAIFAATDCRLLNIDGRRDQEVPQWKAPGAGEELANAKSAARCENGRRTAVPSNRRGTDGTALDRKRVDDLSRRRLRRGNWRLFRCGQIMFALCVSFRGWVAPARVIPVIRRVCRIASQDRDDGRAAIDQRNHAHRRMPSTLLPARRPVRSHGAMRRNHGWDSSWS